ADDADDTEKNKIRAIREIRGQFFSGSEPFIGAWILEFVPPGFPSLPVRIGYIVGRKSKADATHENNRRERVANGFGPTRRRWPSPGRRRPRLRFGQPPAAPGLQSRHPTTQGRQMARGRSGSRKSPGPPG